METVGLKYQKVAEQVSIPRITAFVDFVHRMEF
jgi:hypothetical protein